MNTQYISAVMDAATQYDTLNALMAYAVAALTGAGAGHLTAIKVGHLMMGWV